MNKKILSRLCLLVILLVIVRGHLYGQDSLIIVPDGTQGETFKISRESFTDSISGGAWNEFDGPLSTLKLGGGFLYEYAAYVQDDISKEQIKLEPAFKLRDFRVTMSGKIKVKRSVTWKLGIMFDGPTNSWFVRESGIMVGLPELSGHIFVGRTKEGFSFNKVMNGYSGWTMERQMALDVIPILADGVKLMGFLPKEHLFWNVGVYTDWISDKQSFSTYKWQFAARFGWLPIHSEEDNALFHIGLNYRYGVTDDGKFQLKSRPEVFPAPYFLDTKEFPTDHSSHIGAEVYFSSGPLLVGSEIYMHKFSSPETGNPVFPGGDLVVSFMMTGESRPYSTVSGIYGFVPVENSFFDGGSGAWEMLLRYSSLDLDDGTISGGRFWRITPMINWYLSENVRLELAYGYGVLSRFNLEGATQFFQSRIQLML